MNKVLRTFCFFSLLSAVFAAAAFVPQHADARQELPGRTGKGDRGAARKAVLFVPRFPDFLGTSIRLITRIRRFEAPFRTVPGKRR